MVKSSCTAACERAQLSPTETAALCNGVGGAVASLATQSVIVPIDVVRTAADAPRRDTHSWHSSMWLSVGVIGALSMTQGVVSGVFVLRYIESPIVECRDTISQDPGISRGRTLIKYLQNSTICDVHP